MRDAAGMDRVQRRVGDLLGYLERNRDALVHYAARRRRGEPISTTFMESAMNEIVAKRMNKAQQMRWSRATVQPFLDLRTAVLNGTMSASPDPDGVWGHCACTPDPCTTLHQVKSCNTLLPTLLAADVQGNRPANALHIACGCPVRLIRVEAGVPYGVYERLRLSLIA